MASNSFLKFLLPKKEIFFELFEQVANNSALMGGLLKTLVNETDSDKKSTIVARLADLEHANDDLTHRVFTELGKNFITPFDREDIHYLATSLDDIADYIYAVAKKIMLYRLSTNDLGMQKLAELIEEGAVHVKTAVMELRNMKNMRNITDALVKINSIENQGDDVFDMSIEKLFDTETDAKEVIKKKDIYQIMEVVTDKFEDAGNVVESIIIKYA